MLARLFIFFGGLLVVALFTALLAPLFIDWSSYRGDFEREASAVLGRRVTVRGDAEARLLPFPSLSFSDVVVGEPDAPALTVETFSMDAELAPFMSGEFRIFDMRLVRPKMRVDLAADGTVDWAVRPSTPFDPRHTSLEKLTLLEGEVTIHHALSGRVHRLTEINADLSARSLAGPWRADGSLRVDGMRTKLSASTSTAENGAMRLKLTAAPEPLGMSLTAEGDVRIRNGVADYAGTFRAAEIVAPPAAGKAVRDAKDQAAPAYRLSGSFTFDHRQLAVDTFRFETGPLDDPYTADGKARVELGSAPRFAIEAQGAQVRLDRPEGTEGDPAAPPLTFEERLLRFEEAVQNLPQISIPGTIDVTLPAIVAGDTTVRDVTLSVQPEKGRWQVGKLAATLPGRATLEASGILHTGEGIGFDGTLLLAVAQPSGFAAWLARDVDEAVRRLPAAGFNAKVSLSRAEQKFDDLELVLGGATLRGSIDSLLPLRGRPSATIRLDGGTLDLDQAAAFASLFVSEKGENHFAGRDLDLEVKAGPVAGAGVAADEVDAALRLRDERLEIRRLVLRGFAGATVDATGQISDLGRVPSIRIDGTVEADDLTPLITLASTRFPATPVLDRLPAQAAAIPGLLNASHLALSLRVDGDDPLQRAMSLFVEGETGGTIVKAQLTGTGDPAHPATAKAALSASARNEDGTRLLALSGLPVLPLDLVGSAELSLSATGTAEGGLATKASLSGDNFTLGFDGTVSSGSRGNAASGALRLDTRDIEPWMQTIGAGLPGFGLGTPVELAADADYSDGLLVLSALDGSVDEGKVEGDVNIAWKDGVPDLSGALSLDALELDRAASVVVGAEAFDAEEGMWPSIPFRQTPASPFTLAFDLAVGTLSAGDLGALQSANFSLKLDGTRIALDGLTGTLHGGAVKASAELKNSAGTGLFTSQFSIAGAEAAMLLQQSGISGQADAAASLSANGKTVGGLVTNLAGSGTASLRDLKLQNINEGAFPHLIAQADTIGRDVDADDAARFAPPILAAGNFTAPRAEMAFTVAGGVLRSPTVTLDGSEAKMSADLRIDLNTGDVGVNGALLLDPGEDALVGSEPTVNFSRGGPLATAGLRFDTAPLGQFLTQRALEREQARVEAMQAELLEKQRLRREARLYSTLASERAAIAAELIRQEEAARIRAEERAAAEAEEARRRAEEQERQRAEEAERVRTEEGRRKAQAAQAEEAGQARRAAQERPSAAGEQAAPPTSLDLEQFDPAL